MEAVAWRLTHYNPEGNNSCELCGHPIKREFHVASSTGQYRIVGSECVESLLSADDRSKAALLDKRTTRAAAQWRKKLPAAKDGETREQYIARRLSEMPNAMRAYKVYISMPVQRMVADGFHERQNELPPKPAPNPHGLYDSARMDWERSCDALRKAIYTEIVEKVATETNANAFDFTRPVWDVRKV